MKELKLAKVMLSALSSLSVLLIISTSALADDNTLKVTLQTPTSQNYELVAWICDWFDYYSNGINAVVYKVDWYKNSVYQSNLSQSFTVNLSYRYVPIQRTSTVTKDNLKKGDTWKCVVTPQNGRPAAQVETVISNTPPYFFGIIRLDDEAVQGRFSAFPGAPFYLSAVAVDADGDPLVYTDPVLPSGAMFNPATRMLSWTPLESDAGKNYTLEFKVTDGESVVVTKVNIYVLQHMPAVDLSGYMPPVGAQGCLQSCASWAAGYYYKSFQEGREHGWDLSLPEHQCSASFLYNQITDGYDGGSNEEQVDDILKTQGCASLKDMPYSDDCGILPNATQYEAAMPFRSQGGRYHSISHINEMRNHLANGDVFTIGMLVYSDFYRSATGGNDVYDGRRTDLTFKGSGHALTIVGYDDNREYTSIDGIKRKGAFKFVNSWGSTWSDDGYSWMSYDYVLNCVSQMYTMTDRIDYQPRAIARFHITHPKRGDLDVNLYGVSSNKGPLWYPLFYQKGGAHADIDAAFDISDVVEAGYLPPSLQNTWLLKAQDCVAGQEGSIANFTIKYRANITDAFLEFAARKVPVAIPDATTMDAGPEVSLAIPDRSVVNNPPTKPTVSMNPQQPTVKDDLVATASGSTDPDGDAVSYQYAWFRDGQVESKFVTNTVPAGATLKGQIWRCVVFPYDGKEYGSSNYDEKRIYNSLPALDAIGNKAVQPGVFLGFNVSAQDADNDTLVYSAYNLPSGAVFDSSARMFQWTSASNQVGVYYGIGLEVNDGTDSDKEEITICVGNAQPVPTELAAKPLSSNQIALTWKDNSDNEAGFRIERSLYAKGPFSQIASLAANITSYTNTALKSNTTYYYRVSAYNTNAKSAYSNTASAKTEEVFPWLTVSSTNVSLDLIKNAVTGNTYAKTFSITNNGSASTTFKLMNNNDGMYTPPGGTPQSVVAQGFGFYEASGGVTAHATVNIRAYVNNAKPVGTYTGSYTVNEYRSSTTVPIVTVRYTLRVSENYAVPAAPVNLSAQAASCSQVVLTWDDLSNNENGFKIERSTSAIGTFSQIATVGANMTSYTNINLTSNKTYYYRVRAYNSAGYSEYSNTTSATTLPNQPPVLGSLSNAVIEEGKNLSFAVTGTDPDGDSLTFQTIGLPSGATFTTTRNTAGSIEATFSWTPTSAQVNSYRVGFKVSDGTLTAATSIGIEVKAKPNQLPVLAYIGSKTVETDTLQEFSISATDADGDSLSYSASGLPEGAIFTDQTLSWTPTAAQAGMYYVTFLASDGKGQDSESILITVKLPNRAPVLGSLSNAVIEEGKNLSFTVIGTDADGDSLAFQTMGIPSGATFTVTRNTAGLIEATFSWTPTYTQAGSYRVGFRVSDGTLTASTSIGIEVKEG